MNADLFWGKKFALFLLYLLGTLVMRPTGNENKGAMKLRVDFKQKKIGDLISLFRN